MKAITATLLILASALTIHCALGASTPDRPAGVDAQNWIPVSDKIGFVVTTPRIYPLPVMDKQPLLLPPPAEGYFMVRTGNGWQRIIIQDPLKGPVRQADYHAPTSLAMLATESGIEM
jgi:hypothetical protein